MAHPLHRLSEEIEALKSRHLTEARELEIQHINQRRNLHERQSKEIESLRRSKIFTPLPRFPLTERR
jgi:hypothetical protein